MDFFKEGKKLTYSEVVEVLKSLIKQDILSYLEPNELNNLFIRLLNFTKETLSRCLTSQEYVMRDSRELWTRAMKHKIIANEPVWKKALKLQEEIEKEEGESIDKTSLVEFISGDLCQAMQRLVQHPQIKRL